MGITVHLLTGDSEKSAAAAASSAGIGIFKHGMLPGDKISYIRSLQQQGHKVAMAGDGINDSGALMQADTGIAFASGSDIAADSAGIVLMKPDLEKLVAALKLSRKTVRIIRQNLFWAFFYNLLSIPVAAGILYPFTGILLNPMIAGTAMALSSLMVVTNSMRLRIN
jgi:Cu2+-exporting ATPase